MANLKNINKRILDLSMKYYNTTDLKKLSPYQLNKLTNWATNTNPEFLAKIKGNKYTGRTYKKIKAIF
jgi:hypothetical protein